MTCGAVCQRVEREDHNRGILVYTVIRTSARGSEVVGDAENGMFQNSNEL
jgi:hypothetical protein